MAGTVTSMWCVGLRCSAAREVTARSIAKKAKPGIDNRVLRDSKGWVLALALAAHELLDFALHGTARSGALGERLGNFGLLAGGALRLLAVNLIGNRLGVHS